MSRSNRKVLSPLLVHSLVLQLAVSVVRPSSSYRGLELGMDPAFLGIIAASFTLIPIFLAYRAGRATDSGKRESLLYLGSWLLIVGSLGLLFLTPSILVLLGWNMVLGIGHLLSIVGEQSVVAAGKADDMDTSFGLYTLAISAGQALGPLVLALVGGSQTVPDTNVLFLCSLVAAVAVACSTYFLVRNSRGPRGVERHPGIPAPRALSVDPHQRRAILSAIWISSVMVGTLDLVGAYLPALGVEQGISVAEVGILLSLRAVATMVSRIFIGPVASRLNRRLLIVLSCAILSLGAFGLALPLGILGIAISMAAIGIAFGFSQPLTMSIVTLAAPAGTSGTWLALRMGANRVGQTVIPSALGAFAMSAGSTAVFAAAGGLLAFSTVSAWLAGVRE